MSVPSTSLATTTFLVDAQNLKEQLQNISIDATNDLVDARGIADRYEFNQPVKQSQTIEFTCHIADTTDGNLEATNLDVQLWSIGPSGSLVAYLGQVKSGNLEISNTGPDASGIAVAYRYPVPTKSAVELTTDLMIVTANAFTGAIMTDTTAQMNVQCSIEFAGITMTWNGVLRSSKLVDNRGEIQMENVVIALQGTPVSITGSGVNESVIALAFTGAAVTTGEINTGVGDFKQTSALYMMQKLGLRFADAALIEQTMTLVSQGAMLVS